MIKTICILSLICVCAIMLASCLDSEEQDVSSLEEKQHQMVEEMVKNIQGPLDKANLADELSEDYNRRIKEAVPDQ